MKHNAINNHKNQSVWLMIWDSSMLPKKKQEIKVNSTNKINTGDIIIVAQTQKEKFFKVVEVINEKPSSIKGFVYYTLNTIREIK